MNVELVLSPDEEEIEQELQRSVADDPLKIEQVHDPYAGLLITTIDGLCQHNDTTNGTGRP